MVGLSGDTVVGWLGVAFVFVAMGGEGGEGVVE